MKGDYSQVDDLSASTICSGGTLLCSGHEALWLWGHMRVHIKSKFQKKIFLDQICKMGATN